MVYNTEEMTILKKNIHVKAFSTESVLKITHIVVKKFIRNGSISYNDFQDVSQTVLEKYWKKKDKIESSFSGASKPETYISAIVYRMVLEIIRSEKNKPKHYTDFEPNLETHNHEKVLNPEEELIINNETKYLERVLLTLGDERIKVVLFCKCYFRLWINNEDLIPYVPPHLCDKAYEMLHDTAQLKNKEVYARLCEVHNLVESKTIKPDAIRMYIQKNIEQILFRINGNNRAYYDKDSLRTLFELSDKPIKKQANEITFD